MGPSFCFFMGAAWAIGYFRYFVALQRECSVLLSGVSSVRNLLIDDCRIVLISLDNCWLTLFRRSLSCGFLDWCYFLLSVRFSAMRFLISFGKLRPFSFVLITGVLGKYIKNIYIKYEVTCMLRHEDDVDLGTRWKRVVLTHRPHYPKRK
jgi:hypothetical protein